jgi:hypothetical protein
MQQYLLHPHVHLCVTDDHVVLLDLQRDKYLGIAPSQIPELAATVKGWPSAPPAPANTPTPTAPTDGMLKKMLTSGMLTTDPAVGKEAKPVALPRPARTLTEAELEARPSPRAGQVASFLTAALSSRVRLKRQSIQAVVERVRVRKQRRSALTAQPDLSTAREHVEAFLYLRPLLFGARDECLYDSLALIEFLARYKLHPTWVFGVQTRPFLAHSWVQHEDIVFNDTPEYVARFTPILAV